AIDQKLIRHDGRVIKFLQAATYVKSGQYEKAHAMLDELNASGEDSSLKGEFAKLRFDAYYYENRYDDLLREANSYVQKSTSGTKEWATGLMWASVAKAHKSPPDLTGAASSL